MFHYYKIQYQTDLFLSDGIISSRNVSKWIFSNAFFGYVQGLVPSPLVAKYLTAFLFVKRHSTEAPDKI